MAGACPEDMKAIMGRYLSRAQQLDSLAAKRPGTGAERVAYHCRVKALNMATTKGRDALSDAGNAAFVGALMDDLERQKASLGISPDASADDAVSRSQNLPRCSPWRRLRRVPRRQTAPAPEQRCWHCLHSAYAAGIIAVRRADFLGWRPALSGSRPSSHSPPAPKPSYHHLAVRRRKRANLQCGTLRPRRETWRAVTSMREPAPAALRPPACAECLGDAPAPDMYAHRQLAGRLRHATGTLPRFSM